MITRGHGRMLWMSKCPKDSVRESTLLSMFMMNDQIKLRTKEQNAQGKLSLLQFAFIILIYSGETFQLSMSQIPIGANYLLLQKTLYSEDQGIYKIYKITFHGYDSQYHSLLQLFQPPFQQYDIHTNRLGDFNSMICPLV